MNVYTPDELVRLELLSYENTEGLHPVERAWRNLSRKLLHDLQDIGKAIEKHHSRVPGEGKCFECGLNKSPVMKFPGGMKSNIQFPNTQE